jgi:hypothetical protein
MINLQVQMILQEHIVALKYQITTADEPQGTDATYELLKVDPDASSYLISLLGSSNPVIRDRAALGLHDLKDNKAVEALFLAVKNPENVNHRGTLVYALEELDCSDKLCDVFDLLFYGNAEVKMGAETILDEQKFEFSEADLLGIRSKWQQVQREPSICPDYQNWKESISLMVNAYLAYLEDK